MAASWGLGAFGTRGRMASSALAAVPATTTTQPPVALTVTAIQPPNGATGVAGTGPVTVSFSTPLEASSPLPTLSPPVPGNWERTSPATLSFVPAQAFVPSVRETLTVPAGSQAADGTTLATAVSSRFRVQPGSELRIQQLLARLEFLPLTWAPTGPAPAVTDTAGQAAAAFAAPAGSFAWRWPGTPASLQALWQAGDANVITTGAVMAFESAHGLGVDGVAGPHVWAALLQAVAADQVNTAGYSYGMASLSLPQHFRIWQDGKVVFDSLANTGIPNSPTQSGTWPVYLRYQSTTMSGTNPDGSHYQDPGVPWVSYFHGGDAVHGFNRSGYGYPQSLGCVELPIAAAARAWPLMGYGTLVTVG